MPSGFAIASTCLGGAGNPAGPGTARNARTRAAALLAVVFAASLVALTTGCPAPKPKDAYEHVDTPLLWYDFAQRAISLPAREDDPDNEDALEKPKATAYYLLAQDVRNQYPYSLFEMGWSRFIQQFNIDPSTARILEWEYLDANPVGPQPAARIRIEYPHPEDVGRIQEDLLLVLELAERDYDERFPQWRVVYPYAAYQKEAVWFRHLDDPPDDDENGDGDGESGDDQSGESGDTGEGGSGLDTIAPSGEHTECGE